MKLRHHCWSILKIRKYCSKYDDRLVKILEQVKLQIPDFRYSDALYVLESVEESHKNNQRDVQKKLDNLDIDENSINLLKTKKIVIFDDVLTTGSTFKAAQIKIGRIDDALKIIGIFIAKSIQLTQQTP